MSRGWWKYGKTGNICKRKAGMGVKKDSLWTWCPKAAVVNSSAFFMNLNQVKPFIKAALTAAQVHVAPDFLKWFVWYQTLQIYYHSTSGFFSHENSERTWTKSSSPSLGSWLSRYLRMFITKYLSDCNIRFFPFLH